MNCDWGPLSCSLSNTASRRHAGRSPHRPALFLGSRSHGEERGVLDDEGPSGLAMAQGRVVLMLQEEVIRQPIDYRDIVQSYKTPDQIPGLLESTIRRVVDHLQRAAPARAAPDRESLLQRLDLGDIAAENEIQALDTYFVPTGQFIQARQGHARLVVGRKGSGKTALFYQVRNAVRRGRDRPVVRQTFRSAFYARSIELSQKPERVMWLR